VDLGSATVGASVLDLPASDCPPPFMKFAANWPIRFSSTKGRLRKGDLVLVLQISFGTGPRSDRRTCPQQALRIDARVTVGGDLVVSCIDAQGDGGLVFLPIKVDLLTRPISTPDIDTGAPILRSPMLSNLAVKS